MRGAGDFRVAAHVRAEVNDIKVAKFLGCDLPETVILSGFQIGAISYEGDMPSSANLSEAQRRKRLYISYCLVFCAVLAAM